MRPTLTVIHLNNGSNQLSLRMRLIVALSLLMSLALFASCSASSKSPSTETPKDQVPNAEAPKAPAPSVEAPKDQSARDQPPDDWNSTKIRKLTASDGLDSNYFGAKVAIYENTAIVMSQTVHGYKENYGGAYIFERDKGGADKWGMVKKLTISKGKELTRIDSIAIYADSVIVGAGGSAYIFDRNQGGADNWGMVKKLTAPDIASYANFGASVAIYKDRVIVGAFVHDIDNEKNGPGAAYIFERDKGGGNNWGKVRKLTRSDRHKDDEIDEFGDSVAIYEDTVIVGSFGYVTWQNDIDPGAAYVFERNKGGADNWGMVRKLNPPKADSGYGCSVAIYGNTAIVGAGGDWDRDGGGQGSAYIFERDKGGANNWGMVKKLIPSLRTQRDGFGISVAICADRVIVVAGGDGLRAFIFSRDKGGAGAWGEAERLIGSHSEENPFSASVAIYNDTAIAGAPNAKIGGNEMQGAAYIFSPKTPGR